MTIAPSFSDITYFIEVAQTGNISRAAERLGITQPSLSTAMQRLENALDTQLFIRSRSGVTLTKSGSALLAQGRLLLLSWEQIKSDINKNETSVSGEYVIGCHPSVALYSLNLFLPKLMQKYKDLHIKLKHDLSRKITESVISFEVDFGIVVNPVKHPDLVILELTKDDVMFWTAKKPSPTQDIQSENCVLLADMDLNQAQKLLSSASKKKLVFNRVISSGNLEVITDLTAAGVGVGILPKRVATKDSHLELKPLTGELPVFKDKICLIYRADAQKTKGSQIIQSAIKRAFN